MGFLRVLQPKLVIFLCVLLLIGTVWWLADRVFLSWLAGSAPIQGQLRIARLWLNRLALIATLLAVVWLVWTGVMLAVTNRTQRSDIDRSGLYQQMESLTHR